MTDSAIVPNEGVEGEREKLYEAQLAQWLTDGLNKPGKFNSELARQLNVGPSEVSKMKSNKRKILAYQLFKIAAYIEEAIPLPADLADVATNGRAIPILGEAGRSAWYESDPKEQTGLNFPYLPDSRYRHLPHSATRVVGDDINMVISDNSYAVYVPYWKARNHLTDKDFVLIKQMHKSGGLHKRLIRQVVSLPSHQELRGSSHDQRVNAGSVIRLGDDLYHVDGTSETIDFVGLVVWHGGPIAN